MDIISSPTGAEVFLDGADRPLGTTPLREQRIPAGPHVFVFRMRGHGEVRTEATIARLRVQPTVLAALSPLCELRLTAEHPSAVGATATVLFEGRMIATHTLTAEGVTLDGLRQGPHTVEVSREGYRTIRPTVSVVCGHPAPWPVRLEPLTGVLRIECDRPAATVWIDGTDRGLTRFVTLPVGRHTVEVRVPGAEPQRAEVTIQASVPAQMTAQFDGTITIQCEMLDLYGTPGPCPELMRRDFVDGRQRYGDHQRYTPGDHRVRVELELEEYAPWEGTVAVRAREAVTAPAQLQLRFRLPPWPIDIRTNPTHATIQLDGGEPLPAPLRRGAPPADPARPPSPQSLVHFIRVSARGYESQAFACSTDGAAAPRVRCQRTVELRPIPSTRCAFTSGEFAGTHRDLPITPLRVGEACAEGDSMGEIVPLPVDPPPPSPLCRYDIGPRRGQVVDLGRPLAVGGRCGAGNEWGVIVSPPPR